MKCYMRSQDLGGFSKMTYVTKNGHKIWNSESQKSLYRPDSQEIRWVALNQQTSIYFLWKRECLSSFRGRLSHT